MKKVEAAKKGLTGLLKGFGGLMPLCLSLLFMAAAALPLKAEVPVKFTYQGNLRQGGFLVNGTRNMVFRIYNSSTSVLPAALLWTSAPQDIHISTGVFRVTLEPTFSDWQSGNLWLELQVGSNVMSPREEITSSPYSINTLMLSGKRYTTSDTAPPSASAVAGDLWMDTVSKTLKFFNGTVWILTSGSGIPGAHALTHAAGGGDAITSLGTHTVTGYIDFNAVGELRASGPVSAITIATNAVITGVLNPSSNLLVGGDGYSVTFSSGVHAGWYYGDGSGLNNLNASNITQGQVGGDRIAAGVLVSTHIAAGSLNRTLLDQSGCANGQVLKWDEVTGQWVCGADNSSTPGSESDPLSIHSQSTLQANATFYVSSGTVNHLTVNSSLGVFGPAVHSVPGSADFQPVLGVYTPEMPDGLHAGAMKFGLQDLARKAGYIGFVGAPLAGDEYVSIGIKGAENILSIKGSGRVGFGTNVPEEPIDIYRNAGGGPAIRLNTGGAEFKIGLIQGETNLRIANSAGLAGGQHSLTGLTLDASNNLGLGAAAINSKFSVTGADTQAYSVTVGTGPAPYQMVVTTSGAVGIGTSSPSARLEVTGEETPGAYLMVINSGTKIAAWLKKK